MVTFNSEKVAFCCNCMTNSLWTYALVAIYGILVPPIVVIGIEP